MSDFTQINKLAEVAGKIELIEEFMAYMEKRWGHLPIGQEVLEPRLFAFFGIDPAALEQELAAIKQEEENNESCN